MNANKVITVALAMAFLSAVVGKRRESPVSF